MEDLVVWVDENDKELGHVTRGRAHCEGLLHRTAAVVVRDDKGNILIQERMSGKLDYSSAGHVNVGETYLETATRELKEELGIEGVELEYVGKGMTDEAEHGGDPVKHIYHVFTCTSAPTKLAEAEVKSVFWKSIQELLEEVKNPDTAKKYTPTFVQTLQSFFVS